MRHNESAHYQNRFAEAMIHTSRYSIAGKARLAQDCGLSKMSVIRLLAGNHNPSYRVVHRVIAALEKELGRPLDARDLISYTRREWERSICEVCGCSGCLPAGALRDDGTIDPAYQNIPSGTWKSFIPLGRQQTLYKEEEQ